MCSSKIFRRDNHARSSCWGDLRILVVEGGAGLEGAGKTTPVGEERLVGSTQGSNSGGGVLGFPKLPASLASMLDQFPRKVFRFGSSQFGSRTSVDTICGVAARASQAKCD